MMEMTITSAKCECSHADWQHARENDPRLETEDYAIGQCYVKGCDCEDINIPAPAPRIEARCGVANPGGIPCTKPKGHSHRGDVKHDLGAYGPRIEVEATARPWALKSETGIMAGERGIATTRLHYGDQPEEIQRDKANAALIVQAVNQRQGLIDALRGLAVGIIAPPTSPEAKAELLAEARAALKAAEEAQ
jgi:hypothetical protein